MLGINVKYADDLGHRIEFYKRYFPADYVSQATELANDESDPEQRSSLIAKAKELQDKIKVQIEHDLDRRAVRTGEGQGLGDARAAGGGAARGARRAADG